ncbi:MAG: WG repeat-containing protein [Candidatus Gastranaerophilales bacterium]|nr:WG repeat-containing protein [Candidatus Gastranaerophilales bacterium]
MKKLISFLLLFIISQNASFCETFTTDNLQTYSTNNKYYGLKDKDENVIVKEQYKKLIRLGKNGWIVQTKRNKFGLIDCEGNILVKPKYTRVERYFNRFVKFGNDIDYGLYDENGKTIIPPEYSEIMPLFNKKFLTAKGFKYGIYSDSGEKLLDNVCDYIYMPNPKQICIKYENQVYTLDDDKNNDNIRFLQREQDLKTLRPAKAVPVLVKTGAGAGYSVVSATDYTIKIFSSISNSYEETIDELMFSQGMDTVSSIFNFSWLPKFPVVYFKNYMNNLFNPSNSMFSDVKAELKEQIK